MAKRIYQGYLDPQSDESMPRTTAYRIKKRTETNEQEQLASNVNERESLSFTQAFSSCDESSHYIEDNIERMSVTSPIGERIISNDLSWRQFDFADNEDDDNTIDDIDIWFDAEDNLETSHDGGSINDDKQYDDKETFILNAKLCDCTNTTKAEAIIMVLLLGAQHSLTWTAMIDILAMINALFGRDVVSATKHKLLKHLLLPDNAVKYHLYCPECQLYLEERFDLKITTPLLCTNCQQIISNSKMSFFLTFNFRAQLQQFLENAEVQKILKLQRNEQNRGVLADIYDGRVYKKFIAKNQPSGNRYDLSYTFNSDGCQTSKSSRLAIWPIYAMIHELPPKLRSKYIFMTGLWVSNVEPDMNLFFKPFINEANLLSSEGLQWKLHGEN